MKTDKNNLKRLILKEDTKYQIRTLFFEYESWIRKQGKIEKEGDFQTYMVDFFDEVQIITMQQMKRIDIEQNSTEPF